eukprot:COSAG01_NODE_4210_length_5234_cov_1.828988_1_plen_1673_part_01
MYVCMYRCHVAQRPWIGGRRAVDRRMLWTDYASMDAKKMQSVARRNLRGFDALLQQALAGQWGSPQGPAPSTPSTAPALPHLGSNLSPGATLQLQLKLVHNKQYQRSSDKNSLLRKIVAQATKLDQLQDWAWLTQVIDNITNAATPEQRRQRELAKRAKTLSNILCSEPEDEELEHAWDFQESNAAAIMDVYTDLGKLLALNLAPVVTAFGHRVYPRAVMHSLAEEDSERRAEALADMDDENDTQDVLRRLRQYTQTAITQFKARFQTALTRESRAAYADGFDESIDIEELSGQEYRVLHRAHCRPKTQVIAHLDTEDLDTRYRAGGNICPLTHDLPFGMQKTMCMSDPMYALVVAVGATGHQGRVTPAQYEKALHTVTEWEEYIDDSTDALVDAEILNYLGYGCTSLNPMVVCLRPAGRTHHSAVFVTTLDMLSHTDSVSAHHKLVRSAKQADEIDPGHQESSDSDEESDEEDIPSEAADEDADTYTVAREELKGATTPQTIRACCRYLDHMVEKCTGDHFSVPNVIIQDAAVCIAYSDNPARALAQRITTLAERLAPGSPQLSDHDWRELLGCQDVALTELEPALQAAVTLWCEEQLQESVPAHAEQAYEATFHLAALVYYMATDDEKIYEFLDYVVTLTQHQPATPVNTTATQGHPLMAALIEVLSSRHDMCGPNMATTVSAMAEWVSMSKSNAASVAEWEHQRDGILGTTAAPLAALQLNWWCANATTNLGQHGNELMCTQSMQVDRTRLQNFWLKGEAFHTMVVAVPHEAAHELFIITRVYVTRDNDRYEPLSKAGVMASPHAEKYVAGVGFTMQKLRWEPTAPHEAKLCDWDDTCGTAKDPGWTPVHRKYIFFKTERNVGKQLVTPLTKGKLMTAFVMSASVAEIRTMRSRTATKCAYVELPDSPVLKAYTMSTDSTDAGEAANGDECAPLSPAGQQPMGVPGDEKSPTGDTPPTHDMALDADNSDTVTHGAPMASGSGVAGVQAGADQPVQAACPPSLSNRGLGANRGRGRGDRGRGCSRGHAQGASHEQQRQNHRAALHAAHAQAQAATARAAAEAAQRLGSTEPAVSDMATEHSNGQDGEPVVCHKCDQWPCACAEVQAELRARAETARAAVHRADVTMAAAYAARAAAPPAAANRHPSAAQMTVEYIEGLESHCRLNEIGQSIYLQLLPNVTAWATRLDAPPDNAIGAITAEVLRQGSEEGGTPAEWVQVLTDSDVLQQVAELACDKLRADRLHASVQAQATAQQQAAPSEKPTPPSGRAPSEKSTPPSRRAPSQEAPRVEQAPSEKPTPPSSRGTDATCSMRPHLVKELRKPDVWSDVSGATLHIARGSVVDFGKGSTWAPDLVAIVNAANNGGLTGGGVDAAITAAGGAQLAADRLAMPILAGTQSDRIATGDSVAIGPNQYGTLYARRVIHAVGPDYTVMVQRGGTLQGGDQMLYNAYQSVMRNAASIGAQYIGFPLISGGIFRGPRPLEHVVNIGLCAITNHVYAELREVHVIAFTHDEYGALSTDLVQGYRVPARWAQIQAVMQTGSAPTTAAHQEDAVQHEPARRGVRGSRRGTAPLHFKRDVTAAAQSNSRGGLTAMSAGGRQPDGLSPEKPTHKRRGVEGKPENQESAPITLPYLNTLSPENRRKTLHDEIHRHLIGDEAELCSLTGCEDAVRLL